MKIDGLKKIIKDAVKEAIQEELKDILLEAVRSPKTIVTESFKGTYAQPHIEQPKQLTSAERRNMFSSILEDMQTGKPATTAYSGEFNPVGVMPGGDLPEGEVNLNQIMGLMKGK